eukprot:136066_1
MSGHWFATLRNEWTVYIGQLYTKQTILNSFKYLSAFSLGSICSLFITINFTQHLLGCNLKQLLFKILTKYNEYKIRNISTWRINNISENNNFIMRPSNECVGMDEMYMNLFKPTNWDNPLKLEPILDRINSLKHAFNTAWTLYPCAFPSESCIKEFYIKIGNKQLRTLIYCWPGASNNNGIILHFHGGTWVGGTNENQNNWAALISQQTGMCIYCIEWGVAPEYYHPNGVDDVIDSYKWILQNVSGQLDRIFLSGDSAGANIVLLALQKITHDIKGLNQPFGAILISPPCDMSLSNKYMEINEKKDNLLSKKKLVDILEFVVGNIDRNGNKIDEEKMINMKDKTISPLYGDFSDIITNIYVWASQNEILYGEIVELVDICKKNKINIQYEFNPF